MSTPRTVLMVIALLVLSPFVSAHPDGKAGPKDYCESTIDPVNSKANVGSPDTPPVSDWHDYDEVRVHDYGPGPSGTMVTPETARDGNVVGDCDNDGTPGDFDRHAEYAPAGAFLLARNNTLSFDPDPMVTGDEFQGDGTEICWGRSADHEEAVEDGINGYFDSSVYVYVTDLVLGAAIPFTVASNWARTGEVTALTPNCGDNIVEPCGPDDIPDVTCNSRDRTITIQADTSGTTPDNVGEVSFVAGADGSYVVFVGTPEAPATRGHIWTAPSTGVHCESTPEECAVGVCTDEGTDPPCDDPPVPDCEPTAPEECPDSACEAEDPPPTCETGECTLILLILCELDADLDNIPDPAESALCSNEETRILLNITLQGAAGTCEGEDDYHAPTPPECLPETPENCIENPCEAEDPNPACEDPPAPECLPETPENCIENPCEAEDPNPACEDPPIPDCEPSAPQDCPDDLCEAEDPPPGCNVGECTLIVPILCALDADQDGVPDAVEEELCLRSAVRTFLNITLAGAAGTCEPTGDYTRPTPPSAPTCEDVPQVCDADADADGVPDALEAELCSRNLVRTTLNETLGGIFGTCEPSGDYLPPPPPPAPVVRPKERANDDGTCTLYNDVDDDDDVGNGELSADRPCPRPERRTNPDGSETVYDDKNHNNQLDPGEELFTGNPKTQPNNDGTCTIYNDRNGNGVLDAGEESHVYPCPKPRTRDNQDGTCTLYDDFDDSGTLDAGEEVTNFQCKFSIPLGVTLSGDADDDLLPSGSTITWLDITILPGEEPAFVVAPRTEFVAVDSDDGNRNNPVPWNSVDADNDSIPDAIEPWICEVEKQGDPSDGSCNAALTDYHPPPQVSRPNPWNML